MTRHVSMIIRYDHYDHMLSCRSHFGSSVFLKHHTYMTSDRTAGVCFTRNGVDSAGAELQVKLKAWSKDPKGALRWEGARVLQELLLYHETSPDTRPHIRFREFSTKWAQLAGMAGFGIHNLRFVSAHKALVQREPVADDVDCLNSISTELVWLVLMDSILTRRPMTLRADIEQRAFLLAEGTIDADEAIKVIESFPVWNADLTAACSLLQDHAGRCVHIRDVLDKFQSYADVIVPQRQLVLLSVLLADVSSRCATVRWKLSDITRAVTTVIDESCDTWGEWDLTKVPWLAGGKKRKDPHLLRFIAEAAQSAKRGKTVQNVMAGAGIGWRRQLAKEMQTQSMCHYTAGCYESFEIPQTISAITDGVRIGKPAKELTATIIQSLVTGDLAVLPPAELQEGVRNNPKSTKNRDFPPPKGFCLGFWGLSRGASPKWCFSAVASSSRYPPPPFEKLPLAKGTPQKLPLAIFLAIISKSFSITFEIENKTCH